MDDLSKILVQSLDDLQDWIKLWMIYPRNWFNLWMITRQDQTMDDLSKILVQSLDDLRQDQTIHITS